MKSREIYVLSGVAILIIVLMLWGSSKSGMEEVGDVNQEVVSGNTNTSAPKPQTQKPSSSVGQPLPTSVNPAVVVEKPVPTVPTAKSLAGSSLRLATYNGKPVSSDSKYTLSFTESDFSLKICNTLSSAYYIDGNAIKASNVMSTKMYCGSPEGIMKIESDASLMLNSGMTTIYRSGSTLILSHSSGIVMAFEGF